MFLTTPVIHTVTRLKTKADYENNLTAIVDRCELLGIKFKKHPGCVTCVKNDEHQQQAILAFAHSFRLRLTWEDDTTVTIWA